MNTQPISPAKWVKGSIYINMTGHTKDTLKQNRSKGVWAEGKHYKKAPDGVVYYNHAALDDFIDKA